MKDNKEEEDSDDDDDDDDDDDVVVVVTDAEILHHARSNHVNMDHFHLLLHLPEHSKVDKPVAFPYVPPGHLYIFPSLQKCPTGQIFCAYRV